MGLNHYDNSLSGSIPAELGNLTKLMFLQIRGNSFSGSIPAELGNLTNLTNLALDNNSLSGSIPVELGSLTNLSTLKLHNNSLIGSIPAELGNLTNLSFLELSNNSLTGPIPSELSNLQKLDSLFLAQNSLTGRTPQWILDRSWTNLALNAAFNYMPVLEWSSPYNGVTPDSSLGLDLNNIGFFDQEPKMFRDDSVPAIYIYTCINAFTDGLASSLNGISQFDIDLKVVSLSDSTVQVDQSRQFNTIGAFNESAESPDCSGKFETTTGVYTDIIQVGTSVLDTTWSLIDSTNLILKLDDYTELTAN